MAGRAVNSDNLLGVDYRRPPGRRLADLPVWMPALVCPEAGSYGGSDGLSRSVNAVTSGTTELSEGTSAGGTGFGSGP